MKQILSLFIIFYFTISEIQAFQEFPYVIERLQKNDTIKEPDVTLWLQIKKDVLIETFFEFVDSVVFAYDSIVQYQLSEHLLVRSNPKIIDSLANTDYYRMILKDSFVYDQKKMIVLRKDDSIQIPAYSTAVETIQNFANTLIDINIPEFKLRIYQDSVLLYTFPVRVGQNRHRYLAMNDRITDLRTKYGQGQIIRHARDPDFYSPTTGKQFYLTKRDDYKVTLMPKIPWIETEINGVRNGQMIHPTTNPVTLSKAYSNGCIGTKEADSWIIYYHAPIGTSIMIRYDLSVKNENGESILLEDIYRYNK